MLRRNLTLAAAFTLWMVLITARLYYVQVIQYVHWLGRAEQQQERTILLAPHRGAIYDRRLRPLAMTLPVDSVYAVPSHLVDPERAARLLAPALGMEPEELDARFAAQRSFCWVKRKVTAAESARVEALKLPGIYLQKETKRFYPMGDLAASVLGYVGMDDRGLAGLEYSLNSEIGGQPGHALVMEDARRRTFSSRDDPGQPGANVELTLDASVQYIAQSVLAATVQKWHAKGGVAIVQNPDTGDILAMASEPTFNPNHYAATPAKDRINRGVAWLFEPGSTFKVVALTAAIQDHLVRPSTLIDCQMGAIALAGRTIHDDVGAIRHEGSGDLTVSQVLAYSSDVGVVKVALRLGETRFYDTIRSFGFGSRTDVGLPGEEQGLLAPPDRWSGVSIGELAIGQGIGITPLQLVDAYSSIANGGTLIQPRIVESVGSGHDPLPPERRWRVVSAQTAAVMRQMLEGVVAFGTGMGAQLDSYSAAGKTGTAQKVDPNGHYSHTHYVASFVGFAPASHPAFTLLVSIDTPVGAIYGAEVAAPAWKQIAQETLNYLNVPHDEPLKPPLEMAQKPRKTQDLDPPSAGSLPPPQPKLATVFLNSQEGHQGQGTIVIDAGPAVTVPDFTGLDERRVADDCQQLGLELNLAGSGLAVRQEPAPGARAPEGSSVQVVFAR